VLLVQRDSHAASIVFKWGVCRSLAEVALDDLDSPIGATGAAHLALGSLQISASTGGNIPLHPDARVASAGAISIINSPGLCPCQVDAFVSSQQSSGWAGTETNTGNGATASCSACPAALCP